MIETMRATVFPWHCDHYHHMNTRHYLGIFDDAGAHMMLAFGYSLERDPSLRIGWADVEQTIRYRQEVSSGALLAVQSAPVAVTAKSIRYRHIMINLTTEAEVASLDGVAVCIDLDRRRAREVPAAIAERCIELGAELRA